MGSQFPPNLSCLQNNLLENNVELVPFKSNLGTVLVFLASVLECHHFSTRNNPVFSSVTIFHILKNENYELCFWQISSSIKLRLGKITKGVLECHHISYFEKWLWAMFFGMFLRWWNYDRKKLWQEKKITMLVYLVLWGNSFWYYLHT